MSVGLVLFGQSFVDLVFFERSRFSREALDPSATILDFETCEVCRSEASTDYGTAECLDGLKARSIMVTESEGVEKSTEVETSQPEPEPIEGVECYVSSDGSAV